MTNPYPNLRRTTEKPHPTYLIGTHLDAVLRLCSSVLRRTGEASWFDVPRRQVCFGHELAEAGLPRIVLAVPLFRNGRPVRFDPVMDEWDEDTIVRFIGYSRATPEQKQRWSDEKKRSRENDEAQEEGLARQEAVKVGIEKTDRAYERYSMGKHYRRSAPVRS